MPLQHASGGEGRGGADIRGGDHYSLPWAETQLGLPVRSMQDFIDNIGNWLVKVIVQLITACIAEDFFPPSTSKIGCILSIFAAEFNCMSNFKVMNISLRRRKRRTCLAQ